MCAKFNICAERLNSKMLWLCLFQTKSTTTSEQPLMEQAIVSLPACNLQTTGESCDDDQGKCSSHFNSDEDPEFGKGKLIILLESLLPLLKVIHFFLHVD